MIRFLPALVFAVVLMSWLAFVVVLAGLIIFAIGTLIRIRCEEKFLRETFGTQCDEYSVRVPALVPFLF